DLLAHVVQAGVVTQRDLREARDAGAHALAERIVLHVVAQRLEDLRLLRTRTDDVHITFQHVPQLRELVEARLAEETAEARDARIVLRSPHLLLLARTRGAHRAEL